MAVQPVDHAFESLLDFLKHERGFDFTGYKRPSLMRRVRRQMQVVGVNSFEEYQDYLEVHPEEFTALFNMILINVTGFFRDPDAWQELRETILPSLLRERPTGTLRVWSAGVATGQEALSVAMCLADVLGVEAFRGRVKIYATDVDEEALAVARHSTYTPQELGDVPPELVERYFEPVNGGDRLSFRKDLRRSIIFGRNDLVQDAPISRIDLLSCRNTLMYFNSEQQARIVQRLHFALNPTGVLFIGKAETLWSHSSLFQATDLKRRFFRKLSADPVRDRPQGGTLLPSGWEQPDAARLRDEALLDSPVAHVVVDRHGLLTLANHRAEALFGVGPRDVGRPFQDLELSYRPVELRSHIQQALADRVPVVLKDIEWAQPGGEQMYLEVQIIPLDAGGEGSQGVSLHFSDVTAYRRLQIEFEYANRQLETAYEELHSTNEELETTNEELQSTVEELETTNEELQSTNEELETMNEELQSMNDELHASNEELRLRTLEVGEVNAFMESVLAGLRAAVLVVDAEQRVLVWNRQAEDMWGVRREEAVGRHLLGLDIGLPLERLRPLVRTVLDGGSARDRRGADGDDGGDGSGPAADAAGAGLDTDRPNELHLHALNRRGRTIGVRVTATPLRRDDAVVAGAIIVVERENESGGEGASEPFGGVTGG
jgi:two-component system CheB/CheR fusion protein